MLTPKHFLSQLLFAPVYTVTNAWPTLQLKKEIFFKI